MTSLVALLGIGCRTYRKGRLWKTSWGTITESRQEVTTIQCRRVMEELTKTCMIKDLIKDRWQQSDGGQEQKYICQLKDVCNHTDCSMMHTD